MRRYLRWNVSSQVSAKTKEIRFSVVYRSGEHQVMGIPVLFHVLVQLSLGVSSIVVFTCTALNFGVENLNRAKSDPFFDKEGPKPKLSCALKI